MAPRRAALRRPQGRSPPPGHGVRRHPGAHRQPRRRRGAEVARRRCSTSRSATGTSRPRRRPTSCGSPRRARRCCTRAERHRARSRRSAATTRPRSGCCPRTTRCCVALGISDAQGRIKPSRQAKYRQVEEFLRAARRRDRRRASAAASCARPTEDDPLRVVDLGCGNAYLTFAAHAFLAAASGCRCALIGVDVKEQSRRPQHRGRRRARRRDELDFVRRRASATRCSTEPPDVVLALHACDTATDDALARAVDWEAALVLAAPCCHHDIAAQLRRAPTPGAVRQC